MTETIQPEFLKQDEIPQRNSKFGIGAILMIGLLIVGIVIIGVALADQNQMQPSSGPAPDFTLTTFEGETFKLSDFQGQIVVLNFWAGWCIPCRTEAPMLENIWQEYKDKGVVMLGVAYADNGPSSLAFIDEFGITYHNGPDLGTRISEDYNIQGVPETFIIDRDGNVVDYFYLLETEIQLTSILDRLLVNN